MWIAGHSSLDMKRNEVILEELGAESFETEFIHTDLFGLITYQEWKIQNSKIDTITLRLGLNIIIIIINIIIINNNNNKNIIIIIIKV